MAGHTRAGVTVMAGAQVRRYEGAVSMRVRAKEYTYLRVGSVRRCVKDVQDRACEGNTSVETGG